MTEKPEHEFMILDRVTKIQSIFRKYGIENFCMSYSGGKDSNVLSYLLDLAVPDNNIPRLYVNTGIELKSVKDFVYKKAETDSRIHIILPQKNIRQTLEQYGYPFKSKYHSENLATYQKNGYTLTVKRYLDLEKRFKVTKMSCPHKLRYQFTNDFKLKVSDRCCTEMKEKPLHQWKKKMNFKYEIIGIRRAEGGRRSNAQCLAFQGDKLRAFQPLAVVSDEFEQYLIEKYNIELPSVYYEPYNFTRTGCKGCPFAVELQEELDILEKYFPNERKQCEIIWKPVYEEYRRIGYRLKEKK